MTNTSELLKALANEAKELTVVDEKKKRISNNTHEMTLINYPDLIVTKTMKSQKKHLVILFSSGTAFIKTENEKTGESRNEILTPENYAAFTSGMEPIPLPEDFWATELTNGSVTGNYLIEALQNESVCKAIRKRYFKYFKRSILDDGAYVNYRRTLDVSQRLVERYMIENIDNEKIMRLLADYPYFVKQIEASFGIDNVRDFLKSYDESLVTIRDGGMTRTEEYECEELVFGEGEGYGKVRSCIPGVKMNYQKFKEYVLYTSTTLGYADNFPAFAGEWRDTLNMQYVLYGKIKEKYPENLPVLHNQLAYKCRLKNQEIDEKKFAINVESTKKYEGKADGFVFVAPKTKQDFYDEATAQANCLAGYIRQFTEGSCQILFMRKEKYPDRSFITVEIRNGRVVQAKRARNKEITMAERNSLYNWIGSVNRKDIA